MIDASLGETAGADASFAAQARSASTPTMAETQDISIAPGAGKIMTAYRQKADDICEGPGVHALRLPCRPGRPGLFDRGAPASTRRAKAAVDQIMDAIELASACCHHFSGNFK